MKICRCLEEGAEDFIVKPVKLSDVKRLKGYMTTRDVRGEIENREINVKVNGNHGVGINNKRKLEEASSESSSEPSISSSSVSPSSSSLSSSPDVLDSPIRRLKMTDTEWFGLSYRILSLPFFFSFEYFFDV